jgi:hypothetical protein
MGGQLQSDYYQTIAREFLRRRGAPFFLSPRDLDLIASWEERRVPLDVVLEGLGRAFDVVRDRSRGTRRLGLPFCRVQVEKALAQHLDRKAGGRVSARPRSDKRVMARASAETLLHSLPAEEKELSVQFRKALEVLRSASPDEDSLERIDAEVDGLLVASASAEDFEEAKRRVLTEFPGRSREETEAMVRTRLVQRLRVERKIPYVSLFHY